MVMPPIVKFDIVSVALKDDLKACLFFLFYMIFFDVLCVVLFVIRVLDDLNFV